MQLSRIFPFMLFLALFCCSGLCQSLDGTPEHVVQMALNPNSQSIYSSVMDKQLSRMGDAAAVATIRVLGGRSLTQDEMNRVLLIIQMSFAAPRIVEIESDRQPRAALFLLKHLDLSTADPKLKQQISEERILLESANKAQNE